MIPIIGTPEVVVTFKTQPQDTNVILKWVLKIANVLLGINALWLGFFTIFDLFAIKCIFGGLILA